MHTVIATINCIDADNAATMARSLRSYLGSNANVRVVDHRDVSKRPVVCLDDGTIHDSAADACRAYELDQGNLSRHLRGSLKTVSGLRFRYV